MREEAFKVLVAVQGNEGLNLLTDRDIVVRVRPAGVTDR